MWSLSGIAPRAASPEGGTYTYSGPRLTSTLEWAGVARLQGQREGGARLTAMTRNTASISQRSRHSSSGMSDAA